MLLIVTIWEGQGSWWIGRWALFQCPWYLAPIAKLCVTRRPHDAQQHRTIMIGLYLPKLYGSILESEWSIWAEQNGCHQLHRQAFRRVHKLDHILIAWALIKEERSHNKKIYYYFVDFWKAFDTMLRAWLIQCLEAHWYPYWYAMGNLCTVWILVKKSAVSQWVV